MFSLGSTHRSSDRIARTLVFLSGCPTFPLPARAIETLADAGSCADGGPGWYDSSWDLSCGLDIAEVPDLEDWIGVCHGDGPLSVRA
ncbi:MAG: hypothetical protein K2Y02_03395 [Burkholderiaceae bacterium]|nr:hypothetical protein [Burkholderiaceae bacterium]